MKNVNSFHWIWDFLDPETENWMQIKMLLNVWLKKYNVKVRKSNLEGQNDFCFLKVTKEDVTWMKLRVEL